MRSWLLWASGVIAGGALVSSVACGGSDSSTAKGGGGSGGQAAGGGGSNPTTNSTGGTGGTGGAAQGGGGGTGGSGGTFVPKCENTPNDTIFAIDTLNFGAANTTAWKTIGFDLDGVDSVGDCSITGQCKIDPTGTAAKECTDGTNGIDNSFGHVIVPFLKGDTINIDDQANMAIQAGQFTVILDFVNLAAGMDQGPLVLNLYNGGSLDGAPKFDGSDCWPVTPESLKTPGDITQAKASFAMSQITGDHVVSGMIASLPLALQTSIGEIALNVHAARLEFNLTPTHDGAINGFIGGVLDEGDLLDTVQGVIYKHFNGGQTGANFCHLGDATITSAVDVMDDPTNGAGMTCNGISFGVAFTAKLVKFGGIGPATPVTKNDCPPK
jgi:hypothetical protein